ncbi:hypothetical protein BB559_002804 [Furculomyces boomerangus]|uniref:DNA-directed RNA polymerase III subunit RPC9 n=2 Tax=Harpellales TaxID=61421 RepID=A0A2T9YSE4_9FUNG|nr:hypothetical protein BB559_002804 [Furculomyces boomerangus]PVZ99087.1 hypothetical protein BB558_004911 [Smittium angustum]
MEILELQTALLSNYELYKLISDEREKSNKNKEKYKQPGNLSMNYLKSTLTIHQNPSQIERFLTELNKFKLTKAEKLQMLNLRPDKEVDLYLIIEEPEERFTADEINEILSIVQNSLEIPEKEEDL